MQDRYMKILRAMVAHDENRFCFDCHQRGPTYVNITVGSFVCTTCGGALRKYNHRVKSISMSNFSSAEIEFLRKRGNKACRKIYLASSTDQEFGIKEMGDAARDDYLRQKYQVQKWYREPTAELDAEAIRENQQIIDRIDQSGSQLKNSRSLPTNAASGLLLPAKPIAVSSNTSPTPQTTGAANNGINTISSRADPFSDGRLGTVSPRLPASPSKTNKTLDLFTTFPSSPVSSVPSKTQNDLFADFSENTAPPLITTNVAQPKSQFESLMSNTFNAWPSSAFEVKTCTPVSTAAFQSAATGDKYAALAELDGLFKSTTTSSVPVPAESSANFHFSMTGPPATSSAIFSQSSTVPISTFSSIQFGQPQNPFFSSFATAPSLPKQYSASNPFTSAPATHQSFAPLFPNIPVSSPPQPVIPPNTRNPFFFEQPTQKPWPSSSANPFLSEASTVSPVCSNGTSNFSWVSQSVGAVNAGGTLSTNGISSSNQPTVADQFFSDFATFGN